MQKTNVRQLDPARYARIKAEQDSLMKQAEGMLKMIRLCPYCDHRIESVAQGSHGYVITKCSHCGEEIVFPPLLFRRAR